MVVPGAKPQPVHGLEGRSVLGLNVSRDGNWAVAATSEFKHSHIVRVDLKAGEAVALTAEGGFGEYQAAEDFSGRHAGVMDPSHGRGQCGNQATGCGREDGVYVRVRTLVYEWLDEQRIAVSCDGTVQVVDDRVEQASKRIQRGMADGKEAIK